MIKIVGIVLIAHLSLSSASAILSSLPVAVANTGNSVQSQTQDSLGNYAFAYTENHATGGTSRKESGNPLGQVVGSYSLGIVDGRQRIVNYVADAYGFRAQVLTNEPGTAPTDQPLPVAQPVPVAVAHQPTAYLTGHPGYPQPALPAVQPVAYAPTYSVSPYLG
ncbi:cuticle protein 14-like [Panonychus citri]|uniref:cuticle protein 14-like n=1 Tax=Panonychus citri TaxID=50023 RepID=UPI002306E7F0|nr:cuticle protein 14-like [Panonychus citri]XP_053210340.1 cuticle protein 14-like [Panonychus citri]